MDEWCERSSEWMSRWPGTYISILACSYPWHLGRISHSAHGACAPGLAPKGASRPPLGLRPPRDRKKREKWEKKLKDKERKTKMMKRENNEEDFGSLLLV